jgi:hypothetical protein
VFLNVQPIKPPRPANADPFTYREKRKPRWRSSWIEHGGVEIYRSREVTTPEVAVRLAKQWFEQERETRQLVDTTDFPERFGYTHAKKGN